MVVPHQRYRAFTLIELLVVMVAVGILSALSLPVVSQSIKQGKKTKDLHHVRELGMVLYQHSSEDDGKYLTTDIHEDPATTSVQIFNHLKALGYLENVEIAGCSGYRAENKTSDLVESEVGWSYVAGMSFTTAESRPVLFSRHAFRTLDDLVDENPVDVDKNPWRHEAVMLFYNSGNVELKKPDHNLVIREVVNGAFPANALLLHPTGSNVQTISSMNYAADFSMDISFSVVGP